MVNPPPGFPSSSFPTHRHLTSGTAMATPDEYYKLLAAQNQASQQQPQQLQQPSHYAGYSAAPPQYDGGYHNRPVGYQSPPVPYSQYGSGTTPTPAYYAYPPHSPDPSSSSTPPQYTPQGSEAGQGYGANVYDRQPHAGWSEAEPAYRDGMYDPHLQSGQERGLGATLLGGTGGAYFGHKHGHGVMGAVAGAVAANLAEAAVKKGKKEKKEKKDKKKHKHKHKHKERHYYGSGGESDGGEYKKKRHRKKEKEGHDLYKHGFSTGGGNTFSHISRDVDGGDERFLFVRGLGVEEGYSRSRSRSRAHSRHGRRSSRSSSSSSSSTSNSSSSDSSSSDSD